MGYVERWRFPAVWWSAAECILIFVHVVAHDESDDNGYHEDESDGEDG